MMHSLREGGKLKAESWHAGCERFLARSRLRLPARKLCEMKTLSVGASKSRWRTQNCIRISFVLTAKLCELKTLSVGATKSRWRTQNSIRISLALTQQNTRLFEGACGTVRGRHLKPGCCTAHLTAENSAMKAVLRQCAVPGARPTSFVCQDTLRNENDISWREHISLAHAEQLKDLVFPISKTLDAQQEHVARSKADT